MNTAEAVRSQIETSTDAHTHLEGRWLWLARLIWGVAMIGVVWLFADAVFLQIERLPTDCQTGICKMLQLTAQPSATFEAIGLSFKTYTLLTLGYDVVFALAYLVCTIIIFWFRPDDWLAIFISLTMILAGIGSSPLLQIHVSAQQAMYLPVNLLAALGFGLFPVASFLFPDGYFVPRWTVWLTVIWTAISFLAPFTSFLFTMPWFILVVIWAGSGLYAQAYRYRYVSTPTERQQTKWVLFGAGMLFAGALIVVIPQLFLSAVLQPSESGSGGSIGMILILVSFCLSLIPLTIFPVSVTIATLRLKLWNVDPLINRSLVYSSLSIVLGVVFAWFFFIAWLILDEVFGSYQIPLATAVSSGIVVGLFNPTQQRLRRFIDRHFYGIELDYLQVVKNQVAQQTQAEADIPAKINFGKYTNLELLGRGAMGEIYRGQHPTTGHSVAIKILSPHLLTHEESLKRFTREAQTIARLKHPNIITLYDFGEQNGMPYMIMEHIQGRDLGQILRERGRLPLDETLALLGEIAAALDYAHAQGIVHRDIKPANIMIEPLNLPANRLPHRVVLMDFGIVKVYSAITNLTNAGLVGTLEYISPEQIQGEAGIDQRADIYSLGVMSYQLLTGELPFQHSNPNALIMSHLIQPPPDPREITPDLPELAAEAIIQAMAKKPGERFETAGEMVAQMTGD